MRSPPSLTPRCVGCLALLALGCGRVPLDQPPEDVDAAVGGNPPVASTLTALCREFYAHAVRAQSRCFGDAPAGAWEAFITEQCDPLDGMVASGRIEYDAAAVAACIDRFDATHATSCQFAAGYCNEAIFGHVPDGARCTITPECSPSSSCERPDPSTCGAKVCTPPGALGAPCGVECADGLICAADGSNVCVPDTGRVGAACLESASCDWGSFCSFAASKTRGTCREGTTGMACQEDSDCPVEDFCDGTCQLRRRVGQSCVLNRQDCVALATCDPATKHCVAAGGAGQPCGEFDYCFLGACSSNHVCASGQPPGSRCEDPAACATGVCNGTCQGCS